MSTLENGIRCSPAIHAPGERQITFGQAIREAIAEEMARDERVFVIGEDVAVAGSVFKVLVGLLEEFGPERVIDSPISEAGIAGIGVGAAITGMRPIVDIMFGDFTTLAMDQLVNQAAKTHYMSGGKLNVPMVLRTTLGASRRSAAQHSQSLHALFSHIPGLKVAMPATPYDAKGLMKSAIRDDNPVIIFEDKMLYQERGPVPEEEYTLPLGQADVKRTGEDITIVATSSMVYVALEAVEKLASIGISAELIDPRTTSPLDTETLIRSAKKNKPGAGRRRGLPAIWRHRGNRLCHRRWCILLSRRPGKAHWRDERAGAVLAGDGGSDDSQRRLRFRDGQSHVRLRQ